MDIEESKWLKKGQDPKELLPARKLKNNKLAPRVSRGYAKIIEQAKDISSPMFGEKVRHMATSEGIFTSMGKPMRELFYRRMIKGEKKSSDITKTLLTESKRLQKSLPAFGRSKSLERIDNYAISRQAGGKVRLNKQGVKIVEELSSKEMKVYDRLQEMYKKLYVKINQTRKAAGLQTFPPVENYSTWIHDMSKLESMERLTMLSNMKKIQKGLDRVSSFCTEPLSRLGITPTERTTISKL